MIGHPQTLSFEVELTYEFWPTYRVETVPLAEFEEIGRLIYKERHRRAKKDRPIQIRWRNVLTKHGEDVYRERYGSLMELSPKLGVPLNDWLKWDRRL